MQLPSAYEEVLLSRGLPLREIGVAATGLARNDALSAIDALSGSTIAIASGDVLRVTNERPQYTFSNWRAQRGIGESLDAFIARSHSIARDYIAKYPEQCGQITLYTLVTAALSAPNDTSRSGSRASAASAGFVR
jgi:hypothetical protein